MPPKPDHSSAEDSIGLLESYKQQRTTTKANISRIKSNLEKRRDTLTALDLESWLELINSYIKNLMCYQTEIEKLDPSDKKRGDLEEICISTKSLLKSMIGGNRHESMANETFSGFAPNFSRLPALKIPKFSGKYADYKNFISSFNSLVHNDPSLSIIQKFNHLISCLTDDALRTVKAFQVNEENYQSALNRLAERFDNKCLIFQDHVNALFDLERIVKPNASALRQVVDNVSAILDSLSHLGSDKDIMHSLVIHLVMSKIDQASRSKWDERQEFKELPQWETCASVLIRRCQFLEVNGDKKSHDNASNTLRNEKRVTRSSFTCARAKVEHCLYCLSDGHVLENCRKFNDLLVSQRFSFVKKNGICINCLKKGHMVSKCKDPKCAVCGKPHNSVLHRYEASQPDVHMVTPPQAQREQRVIEPNNQNNFSVNDGSRCRNTSPISLTPQCAFQRNNVQSMHMGLNSHQLLLATAVVLVKNRSGQYYLARVLLDSCSQVNLMSEEFAQKLKLRKEPCYLNIVGINGTNATVKHKISTHVKSRAVNIEFFVDFCIVKSVSNKQPPFAISKSKISIPSNIQLADPSFDKPGKIDMLLGCEYFLDLLSVGQIKLGPSLPTLQKTLLGWIVSGKCQGSFSDNVSQVCNLVTDSQIVDNSSLDMLVHKFWELEDVPQRILMTEEQMKCEQHFIANTIRLPNGRFEIKLPFKCDPLKLGSSIDTAHKWFLALERRLSKNPEIRKMYNDFMREYVHLGHMSPVGDEILRGPHYVIPHQCVLRPHSSTTKLRVVFDASCKTSTQISLNDILMVGPTIQSDIFSILLKFRFYKYALTADITKMYRQELIHEGDKRFQLILWRESSQKPIQIYKLNTVTYGTSSAPFLAIRCLREIGTLFKLVYPLGSSRVIEDFYVDDLISGADSVEELEKLRFEVTEILKSCGFDLAKWYSSHQIYSDKSSEQNLDFNNTDVTRTLGLIWKTNSDSFTFVLEDNFTNLRATKRNILSISSKLFDPLGLLSPIIIRAKILIQELWKKQLDWDESIPQSLDTIWSNIKKALTDSHKIVVPRFVDISSAYISEVHGFCDASNNAYGCCIYVRTKHPHGITCRLLTAKSKVAPLKVKSLPRLELCAAHLLGKLWHSIKPLIPRYIEKATFWSDSEIVLHWLQNHPSSLSTFAGNRVSEIQEWADARYWRHVPSKDNPADIVSRGSDVDDLMKSIWFTGPRFLYQLPDKWPINPHFDLTPELRSLEKRKTKAVVFVIEHKENIFLELISRYSSYSKVIRIFAYILRAIMKLRKKAVTQSDHTLSTRELDLSFLKMVELLQCTEFSNEIKLIRAGNTPVSSIRTLSPFIQHYEECGFSFSLLRVGGRLLNASLKDEVKFPLLLKKGSHFVKLYLEHLHKTNCHAGPKVLIALMRQKIWLMNCREEARKIVRRCIICYRYKPKLLTQIMGNLPRDRLIAVRPFYICGVDICGPVYTSTRIRGRPPVKTYIAVFVCFATKAVHLEAVSDLMTDTFLSSLCRFVGRRGLPEKIWCDNGTNFIGAANRLNPKVAKERERRKLKDAMAEKGVQFQFIPPRAPHFGGLWEAAVKSAKHHLLRTVGSAGLTFEELTTVLVNVEAMLNSRPIVPLSSDPCDGEPLTPGHLIIGSSIKALPDPSLMTDKLSCLKRYRILSSLKERFWSAWQTDYVLQQQQRVKWFQGTKNVEVGTVVTVHDDNLPPQVWLMGRIVAVEKCSDGKVRIAQVQTKNGIVRRPIHKLAPLPVEDQNELSCHEELQPCKWAGVKEN